MKRARGYGMGNNSGDTLYYNCTISNHTQEQDPNEYPHVRFQENRTTPFIDDVSQYDFSIVRFTMDGPGKALPMFIPTVKVGQSNRDLTIYRVGLMMRKSYVDATNTQRYITCVAQQYIQFHSTSAAWYDANPTAKPRPPLVEQDISSDYYYMATYDDWLTLVNRTLQETYATGPSSLEFAPVGDPTPIAAQWATKWAAATGQPAANAPAIKTPPPFITFSGTGPAGLFTLHGSVYGYGGADRRNPYTQAPGPATAGDDEEWSVLMDDNAYGLFYSFPADYIGLELKDEAGANLGRVVYKLRMSAANSSVEPVQVVESDASGNQTLEPPQRYNYAMTQEAESTSTLWSPVENITFCSTLIPVNMEATGPPVAYGRSSAVAASTNAVSPIVTDIAVAKTDGYGYNQFIAYTPQGEYRMASLVGSGELRQVDVSVFWKCRLTGTLLPLALPNNSTVSIKMMFRKRE